MVELFIGIIFLKDGTTNKHVFATLKDMYDHCIATAKVFDGKYPCELNMGISADEDIHNIYAELRKPENEAPFKGDGRAYVYNVYNEDSFTTHDAERAMILCTYVHEINFYRITADINDINNIAEKITFSTELLN